MDARAPSSSYGTQTPGSTRTRPIGARCARRPLPRAGCDRTARQATGSASKHERLRELGAQALAYEDERIGQLGAAVVFDPVGGSVFERSLAALAPGGRLVTPGAIESPMVSLNLWLVIGKGARIIGTGAASVTSEALDHLIELAGRGELSPVIDRELPRAEAAEAHRLIETRQTFGKIVLRP
ncbi:MAG: zinc-binding dehydrogenase [Gaiellaceae bacterium]